MRTFRQILESKLGNFSYSFPSDPYVQIMDFYLMSALRPTGDEDIDSALDETRKKLYGSLKTQLMDDIYSLAIKPPNAYRGEITLALKYACGSAMETGDRDTVMKVALRLVNKELEQRKTKTDFAIRNIFDAWFKLKNANDFNEIEYCIDRIFDIVHTGGSVFDYVDRWQGVKLQKLLDWKFAVVSPFEYFGKCSKELERLAGFVLHDKPKNHEYDYGSQEEYEKNADKVKEKRKKIKSAWSRSGAQPLEDSE